MSTESTRIVINPASQPGAAHIAASLGKQAAARADVDIRYVGAEDAVYKARTRLALRAALPGVIRDSRSTATESYPYSSFEQGGIRRFERSPFARGLFDGSADLPPFRVF